jgi:hypothetical protein
MNTTLTIRNSSRRIKNEIDREWTELYQEKSKIFLVRETCHELIFYMYFDNIKHPILVTIDFLHNNYPFKAPKIYIGINKKEYISLLPTTWSFSKKILGTECACCNSILCSWGPSYTIIHIMNEIKNNFNLKIRMIEIAYCKKIVDKIFGHYLPIEEFL